MSAHSVIPPSSSHELAHCSMSALMRWTHPERDATPETEEGTAAHWVGSEVLSSYVRGDVLLSSRYLLAQTAPNGVVIDEEIAESADVYISHALKVAQQYGCLRAFHIEERIECATIHTVSFGTPDLWFLIVLDDGRKFLYLYDFKHGHRVVEAYMNWQLIHYYSGIIDKLQKEGLAHDFELTVVMVVVQPRAYHHHGPVREWRINGAELRGHVNWLRSQAEEAMTNPCAKSGPWCRDCAGRLSCDAFMRDVNASMAYASRDVPADMNVQEIGIEKTLLERAQSMIKYRLSAIDSMIEHHGGCPGWTIERGKGRQTWEKIYTPETLKAMGIECKEVPETPAQAIKRGVNEDMVKAMSYRPSTGIKIVSDEKTLATRVFAKG